MLAMRGFAVVLAAALGAALLPGNLPAEAARKEGAGVTYDMFKPEGTTVRPRGRKLDRPQIKNERKKSSVTSAREVTAKKKTQRLLVPAVQKVRDFGRACKRCRAN